MVHSKQVSTRICWQGWIESIQCRAWVWRYKMDNRTHHHLGFNLWINGKVDDRDARFIVAVSDKQHARHQFRIRDMVKGTAWPCMKAKHDIADYYRSGGFKVLSRGNMIPDHVGPPFTGLLPPIETFSVRGARMLDAKLWRIKCFRCMWANKSAVEIEYKFGKVKRYRKETFCYGPKSCPIYDMGPPRKVHYFEEGYLMDTGWMDDLCTERRGEDD
ncbi:MAG: hypothetical protein KJ645_02045 [Planctomycetes bacterium]|nr:hypothetical protein [Planctomycetota bacterium]